jgi:tRNA(Ile)-lysidine synthase
MLERFDKYIRENNLCSPNDKLLLGVSGGVDSIVMADLFIEKNYRIGIAHCNFQLREEESEEDQKFVEKLALIKKIPFYTKRFETKEYARENSMSVQMAARELRYRWFDEIRSKYAYNYIAIGHNLDDVVETFFINLSRGTGIRGLTGIKPVFGDIIRPILFASRKEILSYAEKRNLDFREDSSNIDTIYVRNKIRHNIIPRFNKLTPDFNKTIIETIERLRDAEIILDNAIKGIKSEIIIEQSSNSILIDIDKLKVLKPVYTVLYEIIKDFGFNYKTVKSIISSLADTPGKKFYSKTHRIIKDRSFLIVTDIEKRDYSSVKIKADVAEIAEPVSLSFSKFNRPEKYNIPKETKYAVLDYNKISYPLELRKWRQGDRFIPLGMNNRKKLSNFFIDYKLSIPEKEAVWIITSGEDIIWIVNYRIDERYKVDRNTTDILVIEYKENE